MWWYVRHMRMTVRSAVAALSLVLVAVLSLGVGTAAAQENDSYVGAEVESATLIRPSAAPAAANSAAVSNSSLAFTGSDAATLALIGAVAVVAGGSILIVRRRNATI